MTLDEVRALKRRLRGEQSLGTLVSRSAPRKVYGMGIRDGRGYGPYGTGYYDDPRGYGGVLPYGPNGERLPSKDYDVQPGPRGGFIPHGAPLKMAPGVTMVDENGSYSTSDNVPHVGCGLDFLGAHTYPAHGPAHFVEPMGGRPRSGAMLRSRLHSMADLVENLEAIVSRDDEVPAWVSDVVATSYDRLSLAHGYLEPRASGV